MYVWPLSYNTNNLVLTSPRLVICWILVTCEDDFEIKFLRQPRGSVSAHRSVVGISPVGFCLAEVVAEAGPLSIEDIFRYDEVSRFSVSSTD